MLKVSKVSSHVSDWATDAVTCLRLSPCAIGGRVGKHQQLMESCKKLRMYRPCWGVYWYRFIMNGTNGISSAHSSGEASTTLNITLNTLVQMLTMLKQRLSEPALQAEIDSRLHDPETLPDKEIVPLAAKAVNVLHEIEQMLQPAQLILADHFLGIHIHTVLLSHHPN